MELIDRATALELGLPKYFTGKECLNGHISERKVCSGSCAACDVIRTQRWREQGCLETHNLSGKELPSVDYLNEKFKYEDGLLYWKTRNGRLAGHIHKTNKYLEVRLDGKLYKGHRLIYKMLSGEEPIGIVDHIDGDPSNNRFENLRLATPQENSRNSAKGLRRGSSEYKGVFGKGNKWSCSITVNDSSITKSFATEIEAAQHYDFMVKELFGEFAKLNFPELQDE